MSGWSQEMIDRLREMHAKGMTASWMAAEFGHGMSRNAVIGKLHRLGLKREPAVRVVDPKPRATKPSAPIPLQPARSLNPPPVELEVQIESIEPAVDVERNQAKGGSIGALDAAFQMCRWIIQDDPSRSGRDLYCGEPVSGHTSWCEHHRLRARASRAEAAQLVGRGDTPQGDRRHLAGAAKKMFRVWA